ncbi:hypothetical protein BDV96DRAFT_490507 [Lophiotrema nucula]|uniref:Uncharacterized protein n=1 Tax=Lophiotrema nucula TaxID=690887 RepID=A0A6A5ZFC9_9PLEO|nr:hypothetical protein BDV96DRAFT_490507 [Lophiotrema nucula]
MAEAEQDRATPRSTSNAERERERELKAPKDKNCPFCGQAFTSSSLGRHLDLYIRQKNPKAPDGIHEVEEIKKIRSGITRRQVKAASIKKEGGGTSTPSKKQSVTGDASPTIVHSPSEADDSLILPKTRPQFNDVSWQSNGAPLRTLGAKTPEVRRTVSRQVQKAELDQRHKTTDDADTVQATEMALREVLKTVREANAKTSNVGLFDFDPYTLSFPSLCLHILPAPPTLFSHTPFPTNETWSIHPPGKQQYDALNKQVRERLLAYQRQKQINQLYPPNSNPSTAHNSPLPTPPLFDPDPQKLFSHVTEAFTQWKALTEKQRQEAWQLEVLRAHARETDLRKEAEMSLENARREIEHLKANRWSSGAPELSPIRLNICPETSKELGKHGLDFRNWDYDRLIEKWKGVVKEGKNAAGGLAAQKPLPGHLSRSVSMASLPTQSFAPVHERPQDVKLPQSYSGPPTTNGTEPSSDQVDAEGEYDDGDVDLDAEAASDEGSMMNTNQHGLPLQPTPIHPSQMQAHAQLQQQVHAMAQAQAAHAQAQAQAQAHAWARQQMNQSRNGHHPHQHQQLSPHPAHMSPHHSHISSAANSRRTSQVMLENHMVPSNGMMMEGIESHQEQFLRMGMNMGAPDGFISAGGDGV